MLLNRVSSLAPLFTTPQFGFATKSLKLIKLRMKAVTSIKKITKAMKMVAASKMKADVARLERAKYFGVGSIDKVMQNETYMHKKKPTTTPKKWMLVPITTDKGLCGGTNSSIVREVKSMVKGDRSAFKIFVVGDKGSAALARPMPDIMEFAVTQVHTPVNFPIAASIANQVLERSAGFDRITLVYNEYKNAISQIQRKVEILSKEEFLGSFKYVVKHEAEQPDLGPASHFFYEFYLASTFYNAMLNNIASEQSARMNAMQNASKNAGEILDKLTLNYNQARQAKITMELCEIISGASAV